MKTHIIASTLFLFALLSLCRHPSLIPTAHSQLLALPVVDRNESTYIVHVEKPMGHSHLGLDDLNKWYQSFLPSRTSNHESSQKNHMVYSYRNAISGFAVRLTLDELRAIQRMKGFVRAHRDRKLSLHTTHVGEFLGLGPHTCFLRDTSAGKGIIIAILDTGIFPSHPSFKDDGMAHPPSKWKGHCDFKPAHCNNKLVGAKSFNNGCKDVPLDYVGHGTHTASIAAGGVVRSVHVLGSAKGTASGVAPNAHLAVYKVCHAGGCLESDVLAGIDHAIADGVDVISLSLGGMALPFYEDSIAIGALSAVQKGIFVSCSAGNSGPSKGTVENGAPWVLTVGASTMDRFISATVRLGNGEELMGESAYQPTGFTSTLLPIIYPGMKGGSRAKDCSDGSLSRINVRGKVVLCHTGGSNSSIEKGVVVNKAGGVAMILMNKENQRFTTIARAHVLPTSHVSYLDGSKIAAYVKSTSNPTATIAFRGTFYGTSQSPMVASFSSRGPSRVSEGILKPDIIGPGVNVVAAWPFAVGPASLNSATNSTTPDFNMISGTSMSAPLLAGIAALLKTSHPSWSPAAIKSAIMTTSETLDRDGRPISDETSNATGYFAMGAGHVHPLRADDPGLIYDIQLEDYTRYLCGLGYTDKEVSAVTRYPIECSSVDLLTSEELNYPSISVALASNAEKTITRTVRNVGEADSVYSVQISSPDGVAVTVYPEKLWFKEVGQNMSYNVYFTTGGTGGRHGGVSEGYLRWVSKKHMVRSPISVSFT